MKKFILPSCVVLIFASALVLASPGNRVLVGQKQFVVPGPNGEQNLQQALDKIGIILEKIPSIESGYVDHFQLNAGGLGRPSQVSFNVTPPMAFKLLFLSGNKALGTMTVEEINCGSGEGYRLNLDYSRSSPTISNDYNGFQVDLCGIHGNPNGSLAMTGSMYLVEGPHMGVLAPTILSYMKSTVAPEIYSAIENVFIRGTP